MHTWSKKIKAVGELLFRALILANSIFFIYLLITQPGTAMKVHGGVLSFNFLLLPINFCPFEHWQLKADIT